MRQSKAPSLRGSVTQNNTTIRMRAKAPSGLSGLGFLARLGILAGGALIVIMICVFAWRAGWPQREAMRVEEAGIGLTQKAHFAVRDVVVIGRGQSSKDELLDAIGVERGAPILEFDTNAAAERLAKLPWIASATVERRLPDTIAALVTERVPAARWQHDDKLFVIDTEGEVLSTARPEGFPALPLVVGAGAERESKDFLALLRTFPEVQNRTESVVRVGDRRWDIHLQPKVIVRLPEQDVADALRRLSRLITEDKILDRDVTAIDLRIPDRLIIDPATPPKLGNAKAGDKKL
jgi:cell division protein FtsQ